MRRILLLLFFLMCISACSKSYNEAIYAPFDDLCQIVNSDNNYSNETSDILQVIYDINCQLYNMNVPETYLLEKVWQTFLEDYESFLHVINA